VKLASSLLICSRNRARLLRDTIDSVLAGDELPSEIVVLDQSDAPSSQLTQLQTPTGCEIRYVFTRSRGLSRARNEAAAAARHDILVYCDDDMWASRSWFGEMVGSLADAGPDVAVTGKVVAGDPEVDGGFTPAVAPGDNRVVYRGRVDVDPLAGCNMGMYRSALEVLGGFDERLGAGGRYPAAEDNDLGFRLLEAGYGIIYLPEAMLYHRAWRAGSAYPAVRWRYGRGKGAFYAKHLRVADGHMVKRARRDIGHRLARAPRVVWRRPRFAAGDLLYSLGVLSGGASWLIGSTRRRPNVQGGRPGAEG
jgi:GT2 family glycosyltransferase